MKTFYSKLKITRLFGRVHVKVHGGTPEMLTLATYALASIAADVIRRSGSNGTDMQDTVIETVCKQIRVSTLQLLEQPKEEKS